jgi:hypothetical protein
MLFDGFSGTLDFAEMIQRGRIPPESQSNFRFIFERGGSSNPAKGQFAEVFL